MSVLPEDAIRARVKQLQRHMHFNEAMPMALRMEWEDDRRVLLAENQRLREALGAALPYIDSDGAPPGEAERVYALGREALAGDAP